MEQKITNKIFIASDHAGYDLKSFLCKNWDLIDLGTNSSTESVDYNDYGNKLVNEIKTYNTTGILICKTGIGMSIAANRHNGIRAALCSDVESAKLSREHNNANVLVLASKNDWQVSIDIIKAFLDTNFSNEERHIRRINKLC